MADCEFQLKIQAYHDGELPLADRESVEAHLRACPACAREIERLRRMSQFFASARLPELSPEALQRLHGGRILALEPALVHTSEFFAATAAAILLVCGAWLWRASAPQELVALPSWQEVPVTYQVDDVTDNDPGAHVAQIILTELR